MSNTDPNHAVSQDTLESLLLNAKKARENAYAPYSHYLVGAALLTSDGRVFTGCNVESETFTPTMCAERVAVGSALSAGITRGGLIAIAVTGGKAGSSDQPSPPSPCGVCRQVLFEMSKGRLTVISAGAEGDARKTWTIEELLPDAFSGQI